MLKNITSQQVENLVIAGILILIGLVLSCAFGLLVLIMNSTTLDFKTMSFGEWCLVISFVITYWCGCAVVMVTLIGKLQSLRRKIVNANDSDF